MDRDELEDLLGTLLELRSQQRKLQWYGEVNRRGFRKITKKLDKKVAGASYQRDYLVTKVEPLPFATNSTLTEDMKYVNDWLSIIGDVSLSDDGSSVISTASSRIGSTRAIFNLSPGTSDSIDQAIRNDDSLVLSDLVNQARTAESTAIDQKDLPFQKLLLSLLQRCISYRSNNCMSALLEHITTLDEAEDIDHRNIVHRLVISLGRFHINECKTANAQPAGARLETRQYLVPAEIPVRLPLNRTRSEGDKIPNGSNNRVLSQLQVLEHLLCSLKPQQQSSVISQDSFARIPLHYAAEYGHVAVCELLISRMRIWGFITPTTTITAPEWCDTEKMSPLHMSVMKGHVQTTKLLLSMTTSDEIMPSIRLWTRDEISLLAIASENNRPDVLQLLLNAGFDANQQDGQGESALHISARSNQEACLRILLNSTNGQDPDLDITEDIFGWTPLFSASTNGHLTIVKILLESGANPHQPDLSGWTAAEHAALRGYLDIAELIGECRSRLASKESTIPPRGLSVSPDPLKDNQKLNGNTPTNSMRNVKPVKTFGHRYLTDESMLLISLGSMDPRKQIEPVKLEEISMANVHSTQLDTALSIVVSAVGASGESSVIDLPTEESISTDPITFLTRDLNKVKLLFDIVPTYAGSKDRIVGRGVALLSSIKQSIGSHRMNLQGDVSVPIIAANTLEVIGSVNFNFLVVNPFSHPLMAISEAQTFWKSPVVIGHRGLGKNARTNKSLQLGENTIQSFIAAANLGASYVEFDVQLTKDLVPVIYHDFLVSETGIDAPVHTLTLEQFLHLGKSQTPRMSRQASPSGQRTREDAPYPARPRSYSVGSDDGERTLLAVSDRMKHTRTFKEKGWKANMYGNVIKAPFTTLQEMFKLLPESIGFNIEMKYPMLFESEDQDMDTYAVELNTFVDTVLKQVYDLAKSRRIIFSSFHPDLCIMLAFKQPSIPVLFLTDAGTSPAGDIRAQSLQQAIRFASRWDLLGVVSASEPLVMCPRLVRVVKESGLVCVSYGVQNNEPDNVKVWDDHDISISFANSIIQIQLDEGIDAVIVDKVAAFRKGLIAGE